MKTPITIFAALIFSYSMNGQIKADSSVSVENFKYQDRAYKPSYKKTHCSRCFLLDMEQ